MRHLCGQVRRAAPPWNSSAFAFESAKHLLLRALSGTTKGPERIRDQFFKKKWQLALEKLQRGRDSLQQFNEDHYAALTVMSVECELFCRSFEDISVALGRDKNESWTIFFPCPTRVWKGIWIVALFGTHNWIFIQWKFFYLQLTKHEQYAENSIKSSLCRGSHLPIVSMLINFSA